MLNVNFGWKYIKGYSNRYTETKYDDSHWLCADIPHSLLSITEITYRREITLSRQYDNEYVALSFDGVLEKCEIYLNGKKICSHSGLSGFCIDITNEVMYDKPNIIAVFVTGTSEAGIFREVYIEQKNSNHIKDVYIQTKEVFSDRKLMQIETTLSNDLDFGKLKFTVYFQGAVIEEFECELNGKRKISIVHGVYYAFLWELDNPRLYDLEIKLIQREEILDITTVRFGFKHAEFRYEGFYLNGNKLKLIGLNRSCKYPLIGHAAPKRLQESDADILKYELKLSIVALKNTASKHFLNRCDEIGLLVFEGIDGKTGTGEEKDNYLTCLRETVLRDRNHVSIVLWGTRAPLSPDCDEFYRQTNDLVHKNDYRQTGGIRNTKKSNLLEDVYVYSDYTNNLRSIKKLVQTMGVEEPFLICGHCGVFARPASSYEKRCELALRHLRAINAGYDSFHICGIIGDSFSDEARDFSGVTDAFRVPKSVSNVYRSQEEEMPVLELVTEIELPKIYVLTNCEKIVLIADEKPISQFYPIKHEFKNLLYPPIIVDDFLGNILIKQESFTPLASKMFKKIMAGKNSIIPRLILNFLGISSSRLRGLIEKYKDHILNDIEKYVFEGYIGGEIVIRKEIVRSGNIYLSAKPDTSELKISNTYDMSRVTIKLLTNNDTQQYNSSVAVKLKASGSVSFVGKELFPVQGGQGAFYVKTNGKAGKGSIKIQGDFETQILKFNVLEENK